MFAVFSSKICDGVVAGTVAGAVAGAGAERKIHYDPDHDSDRNLFFLEMIILSMLLCAAIFQ
jgi:hypothetical protein